MITGVDDMPGLCVHGLKMFEVSFIQFESSNLLPSGNLT
jgi:hypothetical protein